RAGKVTSPHQDNDLARLSGEVALVGRLLGARQDSRRATVELHDRRAHVEVGDLGSDDVALAVGVLREDLLALGLAERLLDHLFRGLGADPPERGGRLLEWDHITELRIGLDLLRGVELDLDLRILDLLDDRLEEKDLECPGLDVDLDVDVLLITVGALDRAGDDVADDFLGETHLRGATRESGDELSVHGALPLSSLSRMATKKVGRPTFQTQTQPPASPGAKHNYIKRERQRGSGARTRRARRRRSQRRLRA